MGRLVWGSCRLLEAREEEEGEEGEEGKGGGEWQASSVQRWLGHVFYTSGLRDRRCFQQMLACVFFPMLACNVLLRGLRYKKTRLRYGCEIKKVDGRCREGTRHIERFVSSPEKGPSRNRG